MKQLEPQLFNAPIPLKKKNSQINSNTQSKLDISKSNRESKSNGLSESMKNINNEKESTYHLIVQGSSREDGNQIFLPIQNTLNFLDQTDMT